MPSISRIQKSGDRRLTSPAYSVFVQNTEIRTIIAAAAATFALAGPAHAGTLCVNGRQRRSAQCAGNARIQVLLGLNRPVADPGPTSAAPATAPAARTCSP